MHVHIKAAEGVAKFWLEPIVSLASHYRLQQGDLKKIMEIVEDRQDEFKAAWKNHFRQ